MKRNILGEIAVVLIFLGIAWIFFASMGGEPERIQDPYDGSSRSVYP